MMDAALIARRQAVLGPAYRLFYAEPVHLVRGQGVWLYDPDGAAYLDCYNNVACLGHVQPDVVAAVGGQWAALNTHTRYLHEAPVAYAERLLETLPSGFGHVMFTCTGSEANDLAYRIAKAHTGGTGVLVTASAYHGTTDAVAQFSPSLGAGNPLGPHVRVIKAPDGLRADPATLGGQMAFEVATAVEDLRGQGIRPAALVCDTIFSSDGIFADPPGFLRPAVEAIHALGGLFIADEVQAGFGRTGAGLWGFDRHGVVPDLVTLGKPMGNGQPMGAVAVRPALIAAFAGRTRYFNTFGGNPVSCAAGLAVLDVIARDGIVENAREVGSDLKRKLGALACGDDRIGEVRGAGLYLGVEIVRSRASLEPDPEEATRIVEGLRRRRILISTTGPHANVLKIRPPLVFERRHADLIVAALAEVLAEA